MFNNNTSLKTLDFKCYFPALLDHRDKYIFNGDWRISLGRRRYLTYGAGIYYSGPNSEQETIWMPGPLNSPVNVKVGCLVDFLPVIVCILCETMGIYYI